MNYDIIDFLNQTGTDDRGRTSEQINKFTDAELESTHDYIQWLFPLPERSLYHPTAPILDDETIEAIKINKTLKFNILYNLLTMQLFYFTNTHWMTSYNHNHLRITRIIRFLALVGLEKYATMFYNNLILHITHNDRANTISDFTLGFWKAALEGKLTL